MKFRTTILLERKTATGIEVPPDVVEALGAGKKPPVRVKIGDYEYRSTVAVMGGRYMIPLSAEHRTNAGVAAGDEVDVELTLDDAPRELAVPEDFAAAMNAAAPEAKSFFEGLSYSNKRRFVLSVEGAKTQETRARRIEKAVASLLEGRVV